MKTMIVLIGFAIAVSVGPSSMVSLCSYYNQAALSPDQVDQDMIDAYGADWQNICRNSASRLECKAMIGQYKSDIAAFRSSLADFR